MKCNDLWAIIAKFIGLLRAGGLNPREAALFLVKNLRKTRFYGEKLHQVKFYDRRERNDIIYVHIDVNLEGRGWVCCCSTCNSQKINWWRSCLKSRPSSLEGLLLIDMALKGIHVMLFIFLK